MNPRYHIVTGAAAMQPERIHGWLTEHSYWAKGIPYNIVETMIAHSCCVGAFLDEVQVGFARFITDYAVFAHLADVYVEEPHRGQGLSTLMIDTLMAEPWVKSLRRISLGTRDAHELYARYGFASLRSPDRMMELVQDPYNQNQLQHELSSEQHRAATGIQTTG